LTAVAQVVSSVLQVLQTAAPTGQSETFNTAIYHKQQGVTIITINSPSIQDQIQIYFAKKNVQENLYE